MQPLAIEQHVQQVQTVFKHCQRENHDMLHTMLSLAQLGTGMQFLLLTSPEKQCNTSSALGCSQFGLV
jgi:hypothetical protein